MTTCKVKNCRYQTTHVTMGHKCGKCNAYGHGEIECNNKLALTTLKQYSNEELPIELHCTFGGCKYLKFHTKDAHHCMTCNKRYHSTATCSDIKSTSHYHICCPLCRQQNSISKDQSLIIGSSELCIVCMTNNIQVFLPACGHACLCLTCVTKLNTNVESDTDIKSQTELINENYPIDKIKTFLKDTPSYVIVYEGMGCVSYIRRLNIHSNIEGFFSHSDDVYSSELVKKGEDFIDGYEYVRCDLFHCL
jgi:hypothetical protein